MPEFRLAQVRATTEEELRKPWEDERHWGHGPLGGYFCKRDPRLIVPKRRWPGGTFNLAHRFRDPIPNRSDCAARGACGFVCVSGLWVEVFGLTRDDGPNAHEARCSRP